MPTWSEILDEISREHQKLQRLQPFDVVRRKYLRRIHKITGRNVILYATAFAQEKPCPSSWLSVVDEDIQGLMQVVHGLPKDPTDLILHSPGGSAEAAEGMAVYLHAQYPHLRVIVPQAAMSAATILACSAHEIVMGKHSCLGPTDPQIYVPSQQKYVPAHAIKKQFEMAIENAPKPGMQAWAAILQMYGPALIVECDRVIGLSKTLVNNWLKIWMFADDPEAQSKAKNIAEALAAEEHLSHGRHIGREDLKKMGLKIVDLESDQVLQDAVLSAFHAATHTFAGTAAVKIIENHLGKAFIRVYSPPSG